MTEMYTCEGILPTSSLLHSLTPPTSCTPFHPSHTPFPSIPSYLMSSLEGLDGGEVSATVLRGESLVLFINPGVSLITHLVELEKAVCVCVCVWGGGGYIWLSVGEYLSHCHDF